MISLSAAVLGVSALALALGRRRLLRGRDVRRAATWDCGYARPSTRMQYTAASFAGPVLDPFMGLLHARAHRTAVDGLFPCHASEEIHLDDPGEAAVRWSVGAVSEWLTRLRALQRGPVQLYLLYVLVTLLLLLAWQVHT